MSPHPVLDIADTVHVERVEANFLLSSARFLGLAGAAPIKNSRLDLH
jgi:hypothetical protein